jgi:hypothetical protein
MFQFSSDVNVRYKLLIYLWEKLMAEFQTWGIKGKYRLMGVKNTQTEFKKRTSILVVCVIYHDPRTLYMQ